MNNYTLQEIKNSDTKALQMMQELLVNQGIKKDSNLDYSLGIFDEEYNLIATGSSFMNTLRCFAVDNDHQGEGLLNEIVTALIDHQYEIGNNHFFLYTKANSSKFFTDLGFYEIARVDDTLVFMENNSNGFDSYINNLIDESPSLDKSAAIVMNANPFTNGHLALVEKASKENDLVHLFIVSENLSMFTPEDRLSLVKKGASHLNNVIIHSSGDYMISSATFPSYFLSDEESVIKSQAKLDVIIFEKIAKMLNITTRYVGSEPISQTTSIYNDVMTRELKCLGIKIIEMPRIYYEDKIISASLVRSALKDNNLKLIKNIVPKTTYDFIINKK